MVCAARGGAVAAGVRRDRSRRHVRPRRAGACHAATAWRRWQRRRVAASGGAAVAAAAWLRAARAAGSALRRTALGWRAAPGRCGVGRGAFGAAAGRCRGDERSARRSGRCRRPAGSAPVRLRWATIALIWSIPASTWVTMSGVTVRVWSRSFPSTFSPAWATRSSLGRPRNPQVPLIVCTSRKMSPSVSASSGRTFQRHQRAVEFGQALVRLGQEIGEQIVHGSPLASPSTGREANPWQDFANKR